MQPIRAVLTGDLIRSRKAPPQSVEDAMRVLAGAADDLSQIQRADTRFTRFRGDGWQIYVDAPELSLDAMLYLSARLAASRTGLATRISIAFGTVDSLGSSDLSDASGEAFTLSGEALDQMTRGERIALANRMIVTDWHVAVFELTAWIASRWTPEQAEAYAQLYPPNPDWTYPTQEEIASRLGITRQAVQARLRGAGWDVLQTALEAARRHGWAPIEDGGTQ